MVVVFVVVSVVGVHQIQQLGVHSIIVNDDIDTFSPSKTSFSLLKKILGQMDGRMN